VTLLKGALVSFTPTFLTPVPNVTVFQYNPESLTHTWSQPEPEKSAGTGCACAEAGSPLAVPGMPSEEFSLTLIFDSNQDIADEVPISAELAAVSGVYPRLAALEMLLYPVTGGAMSQLLGQTSAALGLGTPATTYAVPDSTTPLVLFVWGPFRIVPVRVTGLTTVEKLYDELLNPIHAEVQVKLSVMTPTELEAASADNQVLARLATVAYTYTLGIRQLGALANLGNAGVTIAGML
jgi:hypothetical protein